MSDIVVIPNDYLEKYCKIGKGKESCIYGAVGSKGLECHRYTELRIILERKADKGEMSAQSRAEDCPFNKDGDTDEKKT